jgi:F-type H+-transporting ATPase subunit a
MIPISLALALFVMLLEVLVAFIQAFIFTLLTAIFIGMFAHPSH